MSLYPEDGLSRNAKIIIAAAGAGILVLAVMLVLSLIKNKPNAGMNEEAVAAETAQVVEETQESTGENKSGQLRQGEGKTPPPTPDELSEYARGRMALLLSCSLSHASSSKSRSSVSSSSLI